MNTIRFIDQWGPFQPDLDPAERIACLRSLTALVRVYAGLSAADAMLKLQEAESNILALPAALAAFNRIESLPRRRILASFAELERSRRRAAP
jgi:hypothetical protein